jgi:hypothetical protein
MALAENTPDLPAAARNIGRNLEEHFPGLTTNAQVIMLSEETGEFCGAYRRWSGQARRSDTWENVGLELADVVIGAYVVAFYLGMNLNDFIGRKLAVVHSRGWREANTTG